MTDLICAGNWKLNKGPEETLQFFQEFSTDAIDLRLSSFAVFLPALTLSLVPKNLKKWGLNWGAQNVYWEDTGAFTGENSPKVLAEMKTTHALVGHSERRALFGESNEQTNRKVKSLLKNGVTPVLCVGETLGQRKSGSTKEIICAQLREALKGIPKTALMWIAYEPVWAIGTGEVATPEQAEEAHLALRNEMTSLYDEEWASETPILYGGSVKPSNAFDLALQKNVNGFLIGGASLKADTFKEIYEKGSKAKAK